MKLRLPAEWERHEATWLAWPHEKSDWPGKFAPIPWIYAQIVRWGQAPLSEESLMLAQAVFRPDLYDAAVGGSPPAGPGEPGDGIGAFIGPAFVPTDIAGHLAAWRAQRSGRARLSVVR